MKVNILQGIFLILVLFGCKKSEFKADLKDDNLLENNILAELSDENLADLKWINQPKSFKIDSGTIEIVAEKETDFFNNPEDGSVTSTAPILYKEMMGDFVATTLVQPDFSSLWNATALMVYIDNNNWIKFAFENSDATGKSIVSVVTKNVSDDANGAILRDHDQVWLKLIRKDNIYSMLWSSDGTTYNMARLTSMPKVDSIKIGIEVQCPVGESATHYIHYFNLEETSVKDLRKGE